MVYIKSSSACEYFDYDNDKEKGSEKLDYIYANGKIWSEVVTSESTKNTYYHHTDHLGTTVCITDSTGKLLDENTNLYYFNARWYDSDIGRFISEDPARDGANWYGYAGCNPMVYVDRIGLFYYTGNVQQSSNDTKQTDTVKSETPNGMPQNQSPNITGLTGDKTPQVPVPNVEADGENRKIGAMDAVLRPYEPQKASIKTDKVEITLLPKVNTKQKTKNQNKEEKAAWFKGTSVDAPGINSIDLEGGIYSLSTELNDSSIIYGQGQLDLLTANMNISVTDGGGGVGFEVSAVSVSGKIGFQFSLFGYNIQTNIGGSAGIIAGFEGKFDLESGVVVDFGALIKPRIEINWRKNEK